MLADRSTTNARADDEQARAGAVVGPAAAVLLHPPAEFGEGHQQDAAGVASLLELFEERGHRTGDLLQQLLVLLELSRVRVEAADRQVEDAGAEIGVDHLRDQVQVAREAAFGVSEPAAELIRPPTVFHDLAQPADVFVRLQLRPLHELAEVAGRTLRQRGKILDQLAAGFLVRAVSNRYAAAEKAGRRGRTGAAVWD